MKVNDEDLRNCVKTTIFAAKEFPIVHKAIIAIRQ